MPSLKQFGLITGPLKCRTSSCKTTSNWRTWRIRTSCVFRLHLLPCTPIRWRVATPSTQIPTLHMNELDPYHGLSWHTIWPKKWPQQWQVFANASHPIAEDTARTNSLARRPPQKGDRISNHQQPTLILWEIWLSCFYPSIRWKAAKGTGIPEHDQGMTTRKWRFATIYINLIVADASPRMCMSCQKAAQVGYRDKKNKSG